MKKHLILSTCLVSLTTSPLFASDDQQRQLEEQQRILTQSAARVAEKKQENEVVLNALLSNPDLATADEIQTLSPDLQVEYFIRLTAKEEQARASSAASSSSSVAQPASLEAESYELVQSKIIEQRVQDLLKQDNPDLSKVGEAIALKYFEALAAKELAASSASSSSSSSAAPSSNKKEAELLEKALKVIKAQEEKEKRLTASSSSSPSSSSDAASQSISSSTPSSKELEEYNRVRSQRFDKIVQDLLKSSNPDLEKQPDEVVEKYFNALAAKELASSSSATPAAPVMSTAPNTTADQAFALVNISTVTPPAAQTNSSVNNNTTIGAERQSIIIEQDAAYQESLRRDRLKETLPKTIEVIEKEIKKEREQWTSLNKKIQTLVGNQYQKNYTLISAKNSKKTISEETAKAINKDLADIQKQLDALAIETAACKNSIDHKVNSLDAARKQLQELQSKKKS